MFDYIEDAEAVRLQSLIEAESVEQVVVDLMGIDGQNPLRAEIVAAYAKLREVYPPSIEVDL